MEGFSKKSIQNRPIYTFCKIKYYVILYILKIEGASMNIPKYVNHILDLIEEENYEAYLVGGCVRDLYLKKTPNDYDITTNCKIDKLKNIFQMKGYKTISVGEKFGTLVVIVEGKAVEITTYRLEDQYLDGRKPSKVYYTDNIVEDLKRRDFTINAMAYNEKKGLVDPFGGLMDIEKKIVRTVGKAKERFSEDHLRILRGIRFATVLDFKIEGETYKAIGQMSELLSKISAERIREELNKILLSDKPSYGIELMKETGLLREILPEIYPAIDFKQNTPYHQLDVYNHTLRVLDNTPNKLTIRLAALFHDLGKPYTKSTDEGGIDHFYSHNKLGMEISKKIMERLKYPNDMTKRVSSLVYKHMAIDENIGKKGIKKLLSLLGEEDIFDLIELQLADRRGGKLPSNLDDIVAFERNLREILDKKEVYRKNQLAISGKDVLKLGYEQGRQIGEILDYLMDLVLERPELNRRESLIMEIKNKFSK